LNGEAQTLALILAFTVVVGMGFALHYPERTEYPDRCGHHLPPCHACDTPVIQV
jgi:hypothetical protein